MFYMILCAAFLGKIRLFKNSRLFIDMKTYTVVKKELRLGLGPYLDSLRQIKVEVKGDEWERIVIEVGKKVANDPQVYLTGIVPSFGISLLVESLFEELLYED